ncbi:MAG: shikimate dehydrogenase [Planctomycetaceae bacterium]|nr:shikimate dehydrogenase [Planctomycetaceae bacterium]
MICVVVARGRHRQVVAEQNHLAEEGIDLVELRIDYINGTPSVKALTTKRTGPVVITCRRERDGGRWSGTEDQRLALLRTAIVEGAEYVDLEEDIAKQVPRFGKTKRIVSYHNFRETPEDVQAIWERMSECDPDVIKICTHANNPHDNLRILRLVRDAKLPTVGFCMGEMGTMSRILAGRFGSPWTYAAFSHESALAPGQLSYEQMTRIYRYDEINAETDVYGVIADPVGHSLSPQIHNAAFARERLNKVYVPIRVPGDHLAQFFDDASELGIKGLSVTIPHKEAVLGLLTDKDEAVEGIGATNTVVFEGERRRGYNTDYQAAMDSLEIATETVGKEKPFEGKTALVLGAGGVGKAIAFGLVLRGARVVLADGDAGRATELAQRLKCLSAEWDSRHNVAADILVNCTPIGMHPNVDVSPFDKHYLRPSMVVFDAVYNPENTLLVKDAKERNCTVVTGVEMFVRQACLQFEHFTGREGPAQLMRDVIKRATSAAKA